MNFSIVVPVYNEEENINKLLNEIINSIKSITNYEIIVVNDGSEDETKNVLKKFNLYKIKIINHEKNLGQSAAIYSGIKNASYDHIITIDGDLQNDPNDIDKMVKLFKINNYKGLVSGIRRKRKDSLIKRYSSKLANSIRNLILKDGCEDTGCSLKIFEKKYFLKYKFFDGMHRYIPFLFTQSSCKISYIDVNHRFREAGVSKYGTIDRLIKGIIDIIKVKYYLKKND